MSRRHTIWQRGGTGWFYTTIRGRQIRLAQDRKEAERAMHALLARDEEPESPVHGRPTFRKLADDFLDRSRETNKPGTFENHRVYLQSFCDHIGGRRAPDLRGEHVSGWLRKKTTWGPSTRCLAIQAVKAALNHAVREGRLGSNPLSGVKQGKTAHRERILTPGEREIIRGVARGSFRDFLFALEQTGARPFSEIGRLEARFIDWGEGCAELPEHKNTRHGKRRVLYFTPPMVDLLGRLAGMHPAGPLFRNRNGDPWTRLAFYKWAKNFEAAGVAGVTAYTLRHSYATDAIMRGVPLPVLAELMGTSVKMLIEYYGHVAQKKDELRAAAIKALT